MLLSLQVTTGQSTINIEGYVRFIPACANPAVNIQVFENGEFKRSLFVESTNPYRYKGEIEKLSSNSVLELKVQVENPSDYGVDARFDAKYYHPPKKIIVRKLQDIAYAAIETSREKFTEGDYASAIHELESILSLGYDYSDGQTYYMAKILADSYRKIGQREKGIRVITDKVLDNNLSITNGQKFETYKFLSLMYAEMEDYKNQKNVLEKLTVSVELDKIPEDKKLAYFKERYDNLLKFGEYNKFRTYPALEFSNSVAGDSSSVEYDDWQRFMIDLSGYVDLDLTSNVEKDPQQILKQVETLNAGGWQSGRQ
ncbi:hypothetical protein C900_05530 [Fulvivirga imtechensis AK7]|uniref:Uncharacterized protein n=2 Tax=Fulvivirga TaxID=396811 RepID=L8JJR4_9BACT|nr:hypothetical protein C900_05530 [Fulvivirga imtechensis AK7]